MAALVISAAGAAIGYAAAPAFGIAALTGAQIGWSVFGAVASSFGSTQKFQGPRLADLKVVGSEYGQAIPYLQASYRVAGQVWWASDRREIATTQSQGGKGGGPSSETTTYTYEVDLLIGLTDNEIVGVSRIWLNGKLVYTSRSDASQASLDASQNNGIWSRLTIYTGASDQEPDPTYEAAVGVANAPAYRGRGSAFIEGLQLGGSGQIPNLTFEVLTNAGVFIKPMVAVAGGGSNISAFSEDGGETWEQGELPASADWRDIVYAGDRWVAISQGLNTAYTLNGIDWFAGGDMPASLNWNALAYGNGVLAAMPLNAANGDAAYSTDGGLTWQAAEKESTLGNKTGGMVWTGERFIFAGGNGDTFNSADGVTWTKFNVSPMQLSTPGKIAYNPTAQKAFVVGGTGATNFGAYTNKLGTAWTAAGPAPGGESYSQIAANTTTFVATGNTGVVQVSDDGESWTEGSMPVSANWKLGFNGRRFIAIRAGTSETYVSDDGLTWEAHGLLPIGVDWVAVATQPFSETLEPGNETLADVVSRLCLRAGLTAGQIDVTDLAATDKQVRGMAISQITATRTVLEMLASAYHFDARTSDKIYFVNRGGSSVATLAYDDLGASEGEDRPEPLGLKQLNDIETPAQVAVTYANYSQDYQNDTQLSDRLVTAVDVSVASVQLPLALTPSEAKAKADAMSIDQASSMVGTDLGLLGEYARLEPADVITVPNADGQEFRLRIIEKFDAYPLIQLKTVIDNQTALDSDGVTSEDYESSEEVDALATSIMSLLDIPILRDADDDAGFYVAMNGSSVPWPGGTVYRSADDVNYLPIVTVTESAVTGTTTDALDDWDGGRVFDEFSSVTVNVGNGTLSSSTRAAILNSQSVNAMLIGDEIIQFHTATLVSSGVYTLTGLLRGCRGTEWAMTGHSASEECVLLRFAGLRRIDLENSELGVNRYYAGVTLGRPLSSGLTGSPEGGTPFTGNGVGLKPFAPVDVRIERDLVSGDITITAQRRSRLAVRMIGALGINVPIGEDSESFECDIVVSGSPNIARTLTGSLSGTEITFSYTAAQHTSDFGSPQPSEFTVNVYQLSDTVGRGYVASHTG